MGIAPYKYFTYDGESSRNYDVYLTGDGVFNAPERDVEMVEIPGRNGNYALDHGKFKNISVTYKAGIVDYSESNFANKVSAVRNWLCSKVGYKRLSDDYNPNEYRMAVYKSGVNIEHEDLRTGTFEITFECKPQRWLTSGETAVTVANSGTLSNPTKFDAEPLLSVDGYGTISFNGYEVEIENVPIGEVSILVGKSFPTGYTNGKFEQGTVNIGDTITVSIGSLGASARISMNTSTTPTKNGTVTDSNPNFSTRVTNCFISTSNQVFPTIITTCQPLTFTYGTSSTITNTAEVVVDTQGNKCIWTETVTFNGSSGLFQFEIEATNASGSNVVSFVPLNGNSYINFVTANSTVSALGNPTYIDCDIGECYMIKNSEIISLNQYIDLGSDLPKLSSGTNTFALDNTITQLEVTPRWWKV